MLQALFINNSVLWLEKIVEAELHLARVFVNPVLLWDPNYGEVTTGWIDLLFLSVQCTVKTYFPQVY